MEDRLMGEMNWSNTGNNGNLIEWEASSAAGFIGLAERGPVKGAPRLIKNFSEFRKIYGGYLQEEDYGELRFLAHSVEHFFLNGGSRCYIVRVAPACSACAGASLPDQEHELVRLEASNAGEWGNKIHAVLTPSSKAQTKILKIVNMSEEAGCLVENSKGFHPGDVVICNNGSEQVYNRIWLTSGNVLVFQKPLQKNFIKEINQKAKLKECLLTVCEFSLEVSFQDQTEFYENLSLNRNAANFFESELAHSNLIRVHCLNSGTTELCDPFELLTAGRAGDLVKSISFSGGSSGSGSDIVSADFIGTDPDDENCTGIAAFAHNDEVPLMAVPGNTDPDVQMHLIMHCEKTESRFAILDLPENAENSNEIIARRNCFDSYYGAVYHPWFYYSPMGCENKILIPPSGAIVGIYSRIQFMEKAKWFPVNEEIQQCAGLKQRFKKAEQNYLLSTGVNLLIPFSDRGVCTCGTRTLKADYIWQSIYISRLLIAIKYMIKKFIRSALFEPNNEFFRDQAGRSIRVFLRKLWKRGILAGATSEEAFFVELGEYIKSGEATASRCQICKIGLSPLKPAEFVVIEITLPSGDY